MELLTFGARSIVGFTGQLPVSWARRCVLGPITVAALVCPLFALSVAGPSDTTDVPTLVMENGGRLCKSSFFSDYVGDYLIEVF